MAQVHKEISNKYKLAIPISKYIQVKRSNPSKSFDTADDQDIIPHIFTDDTENDGSNQKDGHTTMQESTDKSKPSPAESPKRDSTRKPVLGKFGNLFTTSKKKQVKGTPESPTSPSNEKSVTTFKSEKEIVKQQKKVQIVVTTNSKVQTQVGRSAHPDKTSEPLGKNEKKAINGNHEHAEQKSGTPSVKEVEHTTNNNPIDLTNNVPESSQKSSQKSTLKLDRQTSIEKNLQASTNSPVRRRSSTDEANVKSFVRRLSQESIGAKEESPKIGPKRVSKFSGKVTDSKYKFPDKPYLKLGSTEKLNTPKSSHQVTSLGDQQTPGSPVDPSLSPDTAHCKSVLKKQSNGSDTLSPTSPSDSDILTGPFQEKPKDNHANGHSGKDTILSVDIYLSKNTGSSSPTTTQSCTKEEAMEKNSPTSKKMNRKRRSTKSQSSQNEEKKAETVLQDDVFDESSFKGIEDNSSTGDSSIKSTPLSPESNCTESSSQEIKAGANTKLSPKAESDKDKQQHPASSPVRKKNPSSPTGRKALTRDALFRNQAVAAPARLIALNQPASVTTTKDASVEKTYVHGSLTGNEREDLIDIAGDKSSTAAAAGSLLQSDISGEEIIQPQYTGDSDGNNQQSNPDVAKPQVSLNDSSKSTITSQLNIPAKPKNVELSIKPKAASKIDDPIIEASIPKGNIASKVSLFESKKTSHKQIDFCATKNISQPKKFVERAKLNFGRQVKGNVLKPASQLNANVNKKIENGHSTAKIDTNEKSSIHQQSEDSSVVQGSHMPMEETTDGLETVESVKTAQDSILPLAENEQHNNQFNRITDVDSRLNENNPKSNGLGPTINPEDHLAQVADGSLEGTAGLLKNRDDISSDAGYTGMGNKLDSLTKPTNELPTTKESAVDLANDTTSLLFDHVNSETVSALIKTDENLNHDSEASLALTKESQVSYTNDTTLLSDKVASSETDMSVSSNGKQQEEESQEEHTLHLSQVSESSLGANTTSPNSCDISGSIIVQSDIEKKHSEVKEQLADNDVAENAEICLATDTQVLPADHVNSSKTAPPKTDKNNGTKKEPNISSATLPSDHMDSADLATSLQGSGLELETKSDKEHLLHSSQVSETSLGSVIVHTDIGNKHSEVTTLPSDYVNSERLTSPMKTDKDQTNSAEKVNVVEKSPEHPISKKDKTKTAKETKTKKQPEEAIHHDVKKDLQNGGLASSPIAKHNDICVMPDELPQSEKVTQEKQGQPELLTKAEEQESCVVKGGLEDEPILPVHNEAAKSKSGNEVEGESLETNAVHVQTEDVPQGSASNQNDSKALDANSKIWENIGLETEKNESKQEYTSSSVAPEIKNTVEKVADGVGTTQVLRQEKSQEADSKCTENMSDVPDLRSSQVVVSADQNKEDDYRNVMNHVSEEKEVSYSTEVKNRVDVDVRVPRELQNGCTNASYPAISTHENFNYTESLKTNSPGVYRSPESSFNISAGGEENILDSSSDMEIFAETIRNLDSPITLPQKRKTPRTPKPAGPYFGLPPIHEDYLEKILDTDAFSFGLGNKNKTKDLAPMALFKMQSKETAEKLMPKRASAEQSLLLKSLRSQRGPLSVSQETCDKENTDVSDVAVKKSRIESMYSGLKSLQARENNVFSPTVTSVSTMNCSFDTPRKEFTPSGKSCDLKTSDSAKTAETGVREDLPVQSSQSIPVLSMDSQLKSDDLAGSVPVLNGHQEENLCTTDGKETLSPLESTPKTDKPVNLTDIFYFNGQNEKSLVSSLRSEISDFRTNSLTEFEKCFEAFLSKLAVQGAEKVNPRPGKLVILTEAEYGGAVFEVFTDVADCSAWELSPTIFIKTIRGCWLLYELPNFEGRTIALEEGDIEVANPWGEESQGEEEDVRTPLVIGSLRHVVKDYRICQIDLFTEPGGLGIMNSFMDDAEEIQTYGRLQRTCSIKVHWGVWMIYEEAGFQGVPFILEPGEYPDLSFWNTKEAYIGSLRPLKMGSRKVEIPNEPKIIIFEKPMFEGRQAVLDKETMSFESLELQEASEEESGLPLRTVGSMRVISGLWVGYEKPAFEGHQYLLEEGDYEEWSHWGGFNGLLRSLRPILSDFAAPHMVMYNEKDFAEKAANINVLGIISNMEETGFGVKIQSINVLSGVWVAYECPDFTGEQYILEKGMYSSFSDWGAKNGKISSVQPIVMEHIENPGGHFKVEVFSEPDFQGQSQTFEEDTNNVDQSFKIMSIKVSAGRWTLHDQEDFSGNLWVLEEGTFPNLCAMGCLSDTTIKSVKIINYEFSEPSVMLYGKENLKGRKVKLTKESRDLQAQGYSPDLMSLEVLGGMWVVYEYCNYRGRQLLISPSKITKWQQFSNWRRIGSLRPLQQKRLYFKLRNKDNGMVMSTNGTMDDIKLLRIQVAEESGAEDQVWLYHKGVFRCRISEDCSLASAGTLITAGSKLGLNLEEPGTAAMLWSVSPEGRIFSRSKPNLVLDIKGGSQYDQLHVVLNPVTEGKLSQLWEICLL
ncbi:beta/gamma crystallin domain-containing protein 1 [Gastrophryne carolinensis]